MLTNMKTSCETNLELILLCSNHWLQVKVTALHISVMPLHSNKIMNGHQSLLGTQMVACSGFSVPHPPLAWQEKPLLAGLLRHHRITFTIFQQWLQLGLQCAPGAQLQCCGHLWPGTVQHAMVRESSKCTYVMTIASGLARGQLPLPVQKSPVTIEE